MIKYLKGDATAPIQPNAVIIHICNNKGGWGKGFVLAISKKWPEPEQAYRDWFKGEFNVPQVINDEQKEFALGNMQFVPVFEDNNIWVGNMIAQDDYLRPEHPEGMVYVQYDALNKTLKKAFEFAKAKNLTIHLPRIGCGLAGGSWDLIEALITGHMQEHDVGVFVYDFD